LEFTAFDPEFWEGIGAPREAPGRGAVAATIITDEPAPPIHKLETVAEPELAPTAEPEPPAAFDVAAEASHAPVAPADEEAAEHTLSFEVAAKPEASAAPAEMQAPAENSLAMMGANTSEVKLPAARVREFDSQAEAPAPSTSLSPAASSSPSPSAVAERKGPPREELVAAHEVVVPQVQQAAAPQTLPAPSTPTGEQIDAALRAMSPKDAQDEQSRAALTRREARLAAYATLKEKAAAAIGRDAAAAKAPNRSAGAGSGAANEMGDAGAEGVTEMEGPPRPPLLERLTTGKNLVISEIVLCVAIVMALGLVWHAVSGLFFHPSDGAAAGAASKPHMAASAPEAKAAAVVQTAAAPVEEVAAPMRAPVASAAGAKPGGEIARHLLASHAPAPVVDTDDADSGPRVVEPPPPVFELEETEAVAPKNFENVPASIVEGSQPPLPPWAKALGLDGVVRLDAVIDEQGNLAGARVLSGPEALRRSAVNAVQIWLFAPAKVNGRPTTTHMILTVQFQR
jgi:TonB family protein